MMIKLGAVKRREIGMNDSGEVLSKKTPVQFRRPQGPKAGVSPTGCVVVPIMFKFE